MIVRDQGPAELLKRLSDPFWFQAFGCVLGFDWHSSGVTTTVCGAVKEAAKRYGSDMGIAVCGGKGLVSRKTPEQIMRVCEKTGMDAEKLIYASRTSAKVDNSAVQDGFQLYHHVFFFVPGENIWSVVQQGMNMEKRYARRYHWLAEDKIDFVVEPHAAIACDSKAPTLNLVAGEGDAHRKAMLDISREHPDRIFKELQPLLKQKPLPLFDDIPAADNIIIDSTPADMELPKRHTITTANIKPNALKKVLVKTYEKQAADFEQIIGEPGIGPQALRSLSLIAEIIYNAPASRRDPAAYSFAHGGKDGHPYEVNRKLYDENIARLRETINQSKIGVFDKTKALRSLSEFTDRLQ